MPGRERAGVLGSHSDVAGTATDRHGLPEPSGLRPTIAISFPRRRRLRAEGTDNEEFEKVGREKYDQIRRSGAGTVETRWQRKDGSIFDLADWSLGVTFTALDITERKRAMAEQEKLRLQAILGNAPLALEDGSGSRELQSPRPQRHRGGHARWLRMAEFLLHVHRPSPGTRNPAHRVRSAQHDRDHGTDAIDAARSRAKPLAL